MIRFFTKLTEFFLKLVGNLDTDDSGTIDFFEMLFEPGMPTFAEKLSRFGWTFMLALIATVIVLVLVMVIIRRYEVGIGAAVLIAVATGYLAGHGVMVLALIISVPLALFIRRDKHIISD